MRGCEREASSRSQQQPGQPRSSPRTLWRHQEQLGAASSSQGHPRGMTGPTGAIALAWQLGWGVGSKEQPKRLQEQPGQRRSSPWTPWKRQEQPGAARGNPGINQGRLGRARGSPGVPRSSQQTARSHQELPGAARSTQEPPGLGLESQGDPSQEETLRSSEFTL